MRDYGHDLLLGTFLTPRADRPGDIVALAQLTEQVGLDLVTFQDHPYQPAFLDTWTLLSWVAARTERVRVAPNVLNIPLRMPSVVARAAASLDRLSGGRVELGLGAGGFQDAIAAMGGERLTPGQSVDALSEAIDVIRALWDTTERGGARVDGEHHRVRGAKRGPEPAHDISLWLGAYKPRMLRLVGTKGDGWLPSVPYLDSLDDLAEGNKRIDEAAQAAGRDPREIRRLLNVNGAFTASGGGFLQGPPEQWVEQLLPLVLEDGISAFILGADDPGTIEVFGHEVAPALREAVERERRDAGTQTGGVRSSRALSKRREGIDYDALPDALAGKAIEPGDVGFSSVRSTYVYRGSPGLVLQPETPDDVVAALAYAREQDVPLAIRSGGHGISGRSTNDGGIVIDLGRMNHVEVLDPETGRIRLGPGARWGEVARALAPHGLAMSSGDYGDVGVGGLATTGGIGFLGRRFGLTIDHVVAADVALADGRHVRADDDLLWAVRGAGANFGIVTALELEAYRLGDVVFSIHVFDATDAPALLERWGERVEAAPRELTSFLTLVPGRGATPPVGQAWSVYASDDADAAATALTDLAGAGKLLGRQARLVPYASVVPVHHNPHTGQARMVNHAGLVDHLTPEVSALLGDAVAAGDVPVVQVRAVGGAVNDVDPRATAYAHRTQNFSVNAGAAGGARDRLDALWEQVTPHLTGVYLSFESEPTPERLRLAFPGETLDRLRALKAVYDPGNVFDQNFPIAPAVTA
jgi:hypothetical protein